MSRRDYVGNALCPSFTASLKWLIWNCMYLITVCSLYIDLVTPASSSKNSCSYLNLSPKPWVFIQIFRLKTMSLSYGTFHSSIFNSCSYSADIFGTSTSCVLGSWNSNAGARTTSFSMILTGVGGSIFFSGVFGTSNLLCRNSLSSCLIYFCNFSIMSEFVATFEPYWWIWRMTWSIIWLKSDFIRSSPPWGC